MKKEISEWITLGIPATLLMVFMFLLISKIPKQVPVYETRYCIERRIAFDDCESKTFEEARIKSPNSRIYINNDFIIYYK